MPNAETLSALLDARAPGYTLPKPFYESQEVFEADLEAIFYRNWLMVAFEVELPTDRSYLAITIGRSPILLVRQPGGEIIGFHNSCRHRGSQICVDGPGVANRLVCPYHQWTYRLDGALVGASRMGDGFDRSAFNLRPIRVESVAGCVYICLTDDAPDFSAFRRALEPMLAPHRLREGRLAATSTIIEKANWKLVVENGRECHHCAACHPELQIPFPVSNADRDPVENEVSAAFAARMRELSIEIGPESGDWWNITRFPFNPGSVSFSMDGKPLVNVPMVLEGNGDVGTLRWAIEPNNFCHAAGDNALMFSAMPLSPLETQVTIKWVVNKDAVEGVDYKVDRLTHVWEQTNRQDRDLAENNQRGVASVGYTPGPYSPDGEAYVAKFVDWYAGQLQNYVLDCSKADAVHLI